MLIIAPPTVARKPGRAFVPTAFVRAILLAYGKCGVDPGKALEMAHISPDVVCEPNGRVNAAQFEALSWFAMRELDDEALGWFSRKLPWGAYGMLCRASLTSPTLEIALKRWRRHHHILVDDVLLDLAVTDGVACLSIDERSDLGEHRELCLVTLLRYMLGFACWAIDMKISLISADFPYAAPQHSAIYPTIFTKNLNFCAPRASISFEDRYLSLPLRRDENALNKMLKRALPLTVLPYRRDEHLTERVEQALRMPGAHIPVAEDLAEALNLSTRTLHRQLQKEGASLRRLKESARIERAKHLLTRTTQSIKRVAFGLGFRNEKSFSRAFRQWTGETPSGFRKQAKSTRPQSPPTSTPGN
jgi:AraC-like DNA-binding protein